MVFLVHLRVILISASRDRLSLSLKCAGVHGVTG
jgi:hypothetical protein